MERKNNPDFLLLGLGATLIVFGVLILGSVSSFFSLHKTGNAFYFLNHQLFLGLLPGLFLGFFAYLFPLQKLKKLTVPLLLLNIGFLLLVFFPVIGGQVKGAYRWVGMGPVSFQPSELLKITFILYAASWLSSRVNGFLVPFIAMLGAIAALLLLQKDVSTLGIIALVGLIMYFLAETPIRHILFLMGTGLAALALMIRLAPYRFARFTTFLNPNLDPLGTGYHTKQALIGIGSGGITGVGLGLSFQKFGVLPEPMSDSIFAIFAEEMGLIGGVLLLLLFFAFVWRAFIVAKRAPDRFSKLVAVGIASWIGLQAFINIGSMVGILPVAGIPLPFISYGGSALVSELIGLGLLLNISKT